MSPLLITAGVLGGFVALIGGGELLVRGASNLAAAARVSPLIIGLTVVAFGTSAPELAVSIKSCFEGSSDLAVGNSVGSNLSNLLLILGIAAIAAPLAVNARLFRLDIPVMIAAVATLWFFGKDGRLDRTEGIVCFVALIAYLIFTVAQGRRESAVAAAEAQMAESEIAAGGDATTSRAIGKNLLLVVVGLVLLMLGANWLVTACVALAESFGLSKLVIGLTVVAIGTSLPELVTSLMAALRGHRDLAVGNVVGSNILNILLVLGLSAIVAPAGVDVHAQSLAFDIPVLLLFSLAAVPIFFSGLGVSRTEGVVMVVYYGAYLSYLVWHSMQAPPAQSTPTELLLFVAPLLPLTLLVVYFGWRKSAS